jgi:hypothetical protein
VVQILEDAHLAGGLRAFAIAGERHEIERDFAVHGANQVRHEHEPALEDADEVDFATRMVALDLARNLLDARL